MELFIAIILILVASFWTVSSIVYLFIEEFREQNINVEYIQGMIVFRSETC